MKRLPVNSSRKAPAVPQSRQPDLLQQLENEDRRQRIAAIRLEQERRVAASKGH